MATREFNINRAITAPAAFCVFLCAMQVGSILLETYDATFSGIGDIPFYCSLPMCFFMARSVHLKILKRIEALEGALHAQSEQRRD